MGMFASPNRAAVMNSLPPADRGAGGGMNQTFQNSAQVLSIGIFFTLMIVGLAASLPHAMLTGLQAHGVPHADAATGREPARRSRSCSPRSWATTRSSTWSARTCSAGCRPASMHVLAGRSFFPHLISPSFRTGLHDAFLFAIVACLIAAVASWSRGGKPQARTPAPRPEIRRPSVVASTPARAPRELVRG